MKSYSKNEAKKEIIELVNHFEKNITKFKQSEYKEAQVENDFIRPLFECLNWNVSNRGLEPEKQVFQLQVTGKTGTDNNKRPDYLLRVPDKSTSIMKSVFFIEAKKPIADLKNNEIFIRQVYQYAWSTLNTSDNPNNKVRFALLTNFEEFRFFDCQDASPLKKNRAEVFNKHIIKDWTYKEYVSKFDELWELFEYNNVANGSLEQWQLTDKKLTDNRITPDKVFLEDLREWRITIARSMHKHDKTLDDFSLSSATLLYINRIIFVKMLADRNIEEDYLSNIIEKLDKSKKSELKLFELCKDIFERLDHIYNGSIFNYDKIADEIVIDNLVLKNIFTALKPANSIYTLAAMPVEIIGNVYELFIAEKIAKKGTGLAIIPKYDEKKAGGVYYTPRYIVEYIIDNTLGVKLDECKSPEDVAKIKVLDPACGSGSFLIVAYQKILDWHKKFYYDEIIKWDTKKSNSNKIKNSKSNIVRIINNEISETFQIHLSHKLKSDILLNNIFGVDIDEQAVMVTKFSLSIKALEDSTKEEVVEDFDLFKIPTIPRLENNIKCGNSLIGSDFYIEKSPSLFNIREKRKINTFDWDKEFPNLCDEKKCQFDVIVGNPPYVRFHLLDINIIDYLMNKYKVAKGQIDLYSLFIEKSMSLLNNSAMFGFIIPRFIQFNLDSEPLRKLILNYKIESLTEVGKAFENVNTECLILVINKTNRKSQLKVMEYYPNSIIKHLKSVDQNLFKSYPNLIFNTIISKEDFKLINKLILSNKKLKDLFTLRRGMEIGKSDIREIKTGYKTLLGNDVLRYNLKYENTFVNKNNLEAIRLEKYAKSEKVLIRRVANKLICAYEKPSKNDFYYFTKNIYALTNKNSEIDLKFILGLLNSKLLNFFIKKYYTTKKEEIFPEIQSYQISNIPIKILNLKNLDEKKVYNQLIKYVEDILENQTYLNNSTNDSDKKLYKSICEKLDIQIDKLVYKIYGLNQDEIDIVKGS